MHGRGRTSCCCLPAAADQTRRRLCSRETSLLEATIQTGTHNVRLPDVGSVRADKPSNALKSRSQIAERTGRAQIASNAVERGREGRVGRAGAVMASSKVAPGKLAVLDFATTISLAAPPGPGLRLASYNTMPRPAPPALAPSLSSRPTPPRARRPMCARP